jgi:hypothetical protein
MEQKINLISELLCESDDIQGEFEWLLTYVPEDVINDLHECATNREKNI